VAAVQLADVLDLLVVARVAGASQRGRRVDAELRAALDGEGPHLAQAGPEAGREVGAASAGTGPARHRRCSVFGPLFEYASAAASPTATPASLADPFGDLRQRRDPPLDDGSRLADTDSMKFTLSAAMPSSPAMSLRSRTGVGGAAEPAIIDTAWGQREP
jgi:hypothetical protein